MPSREVLFAQVLGGIQMPGDRLAGVILSAIQQLLGVDPSPGGSTGAQRVPHKLELAKVEGGG